jgi:hypothetical protein
LTTTIAVTRKGEEMQIADLNANGIKYETMFKAVKEEKTPLKLKDVLSFSASVSYGIEQL